MAQQVIAYLSLGSNVGDRIEMLKNAAKILNQSDKLAIKKISSLYETTPIGNEDQPLFVNCAVEVETFFSPKRLLQKTLEIEDLMGRKRTKMRWGPRNIDIDIVLYDNLQCKSPELSIPHPFLLKRLFVLMPILEIASDLVLPSGRKLKKEYDKRFAGNMFLGQSISKLSETIKLEEILST